MLKKRDGEKNPLYLFRNMAYVFVFYWETADNPEMGAVSFGNQTLA